MRREALQAKAIKPSGTRRNGGQWSHQRGLKYG
jgi:hypothetical protein